MWSSVTGSALRAMLPFALLVSQFSSGPVHHGIRLFGLPSRRCNLRIDLPRRGWTKFGWRSRLVLDPKRSDKRSRTSRSRTALSGSSPPPLLPWLRRFGSDASLKLPGLRSGGCFAVARRPLRSPTNCVVAPRASSPRPPPPVSLRSCLRGRLSSLRGV